MRKGSFTAAERYGACHEVIRLLLRLRQERALRRVLRKARSRG